MQKRNKAGINNPLFGVVKSPQTIAKITKLVYVYDAENMNYIGSYSTVDISKEFKIFLFWSPVLYFAKKTKKNVKSH